MSKLKDTKKNIEDYELPNFHTLRQMDNSDCWLTCAEMILNYEGERFVYNRKGFRDFYGGEMYNNLNDDRKNGYVCDYEQNSILGIYKILTNKRYYDEGAPSLGIVDLFADESFVKIYKYLKKNNKPILIGKINPGHAMLIIGIEKKNDVIKYIVADPYTGDKRYLEKTEQIEENGVYA